MASMFKRVPMHRFELCPQRGGRDAFAIDAGTLATLNEQGLTRTFANGGLIA